MWTPSFQRPAASSGASSAAVAEELNEELLGQNVGDFSLGFHGGFNDWLVVWNDYLFPFSWECHHPN